MEAMTEKKIVPQLRFREFEKAWGVTKLSDLTKVYDGTHQTPKYVAQGIPFYSVEHVTANQFEKTKFISEDVFEKENKRVKLQKGDILMTRIGSIGVARIIDWDVNASFYVSLALVKANQLFCSSFFAQLIHSTEFQRELWRRTIHVAFPKKINLGEFSKCVTHLPTLPEQQKIATFLSSVDAKLQQLSKKKSLLADYKKGVMQKIFSQELRFKDANGNKYPEWEEKKLGDVTYKVGKKNKENIKYPIYSINNKEGFLAQSEQFEGMDSNERGYDISMYKIIHPNTFAYNPARINVGSIGYSYNLNKLIISSLYVCFQTSDELDDLFLLSFIGTYNFNKSVLRNVEGGVRQYLFYENFAIIKVPLPSVAEQKKIANFLSALDVKIEKVNTQINNTKAFKKGLLQQMFV